MTRCPNCGSAIRIGAKFCTSCGFRLTVDEPAAAPALSSSRSPFATTSSPAWSADPVDRDEAPALNETFTVDAPEPEDDEPAWSKPVNMTDPASSQGVYGGELDADDDERDDDEDVLTAVGTSDETEDDNHQPGPSWLAPPSPDTSGPVSDDMIAALEGAPPDQLHADIAEESDHEDAAIDVAATATPASVTTYAWDQDDHQIHAVRDVPSDVDDIASTSGVATGETAGDQLAEARSLVAKLTDILAGMQSSGGVAPSASTTVSSIADESDVEALWSVVRSAQERPRDVDVMLDLVLRAETIAAVLTDRQLLLAALRGDEAAVEESWSVDEDDDQPSTYPAWGS